MSRCDKCGATAERAFTCITYRQGLHLDSRYGAMSAGLELCQECAMKFREYVLRFAGDKAAGK